FHTAMPERSVALGYLYVAPEQVEAAEASSLEIDFMHPLHESVTSDRINKHRALGSLTNVWTVNDAQRMRWLIEAGVNGLITDAPDVGRSVVNEWKRGTQA